MSSYFDPAGDENFGVGTALTGAMNDSPLIEHMTLTDKQFGEYLVEQSEFKRIQGAVDRIKWWTLLAGLLGALLGGGGVIGVVEYLLPAARDKAEVRLAHAEADKAAIGLYGELADCVDRLAAVEEDGSHSQWKQAKRAVQQARLDFVSERVRSNLDDLTGPSSEHEALWGFLRRLEQAASRASWQADAAIAIAARPEDGARRFTCEEITAAVERIANHVNVAVHPSHPQAGEDTLRLRQEANEFDKGSKAFIIYLSAIEQASGLAPKEVDVAALLTAMRTVEESRAQMRNAMPGMDHIQVEKYQREVLLPQIDRALTQIKSIC